MWILAFSTKEAFWLLPIWSAMTLSWKQGWKISLEGVVCAARRSPAQQPLLEVLQARVLSPVRVRMQHQDASADVPAQSELNKTPPVHQFTIIKLKKNVLAVPDSEAATNRRLLWKVGQESAASRRKDIFIWHGFRDVNTERRHVWTDCNHMCVFFK